MAPLHVPVALGRWLAILDRLSGGRVVAGLGQGWQHNEFETANVPSSCRGTHTSHSGQLRLKVKETILHRGIVAGQQVSSPHARGWSGGDEERLGEAGVVPAQAGLARAAATTSRSWRRRPRAGGAVPALVSAPGGARGWSREAVRRDEARVVVSARTRLVRLTPSARRPRRRRPRARGWFVFCGLLRQRPQPVKGKD